MQKESKCWGTNYVFIDNAVCRLCRIEVDPGGYCSEHHHEYMNNLFVVEHGQLEIEQWQNKEMIDVTVLDKLDMLICPPNQVHKFRALSHVVAYELYWPNLINGFDIIRRVLGGKN